MIYLQKNDIWDEVFARYRISYSYTLDSLQFMPENDVDYFCWFLRKNMREDLKQAKKDAKKTVKKLRRADRRARRKARWARIKAMFKRKKSNPAAENIPPVSLPAEAQSKEMTDERKE